MPLNPAAAPSAGHQPSVARQMVTTAEPTHISDLRLDQQSVRGIDGTMRRAVRGHPLGIRDKLRNKRINRKRALGERPYAVIKRIFYAGHVLVTTLARVRVKMVFACLCYNLLQLNTLGAG